jgi:hypothetical protein
MMGMIIIIVALIIIAILGLYFYKKSKSKSSVEHHVFEPPPLGPGNEESDKKTNKQDGKGDRNT